MCIDTFIFYVLVLAGSNMICVVFFIFLVNDNKMFFENVCLCFVCLYTSAYKTSPGINSSQAV